ncbi:MAG: tRNA glutamyl-Q(34) synthetase GluQRS [Moraxellaceae bacterium]|nr:MAG: tRNA glutamyl-Q(34) synthetase GluQRS [Moraxellaceae bacterium]
MPNYTGRFAPSPTGPLHFGSLVTAVASYLDAKQQGGKWLVRMEDLDPPREMPGAADAILTALELHGLHWDDSVSYQSQRHEHYETVIQSLLTNNQAFYCTCTRKQLAAQHNIHHIDTCHKRPSPPNEPYSIRLTAQDTSICIDDKLQGSFCQNIKHDISDFIIKRKDGLYAYHLAVVVDDQWQQITHIMRGIDLLDSTPRQCFLQQHLNYTTPEYSHLPVIVNSQGQKLSKQTYAKAIPTTHCNQSLWTALWVLGLNPTTELQQETPEQILNWGIQAWNTDKLIGLSRIDSTAIAFDG